MAENQPTWDFVFPEGGGFDFEDLPIPILNCLDDGTYEEVERAIAIIKLRTGATQATAWITLFEQILKLRQFACNSERKKSTELELIKSSLIKDEVISLPENTIGLRLDFIGDPVNFEVRPTLSLQAPSKFYFGGVSFNYLGGYMPEQPLERVTNFVSCPIGCSSALIYLFPRVGMKVSAVIEK